MGMSSLSPLSSLALTDLAQQKKMFTKYYQCFLSNILDPAIIVFLSL